MGICSGYVPNIRPTGPVDYILVAMEPSTGGPGGKAPRCSHDQTARNFTWSVEDFLLHHCIREYLCGNGDGRTYHITDLSKGGMPTKDAKNLKGCLYERWQCLLECEFRLLNKPGKTRVIAIGKVVEAFLGKKFTREPVKRILHYSRNAAKYRNWCIEPWVDEFPAFRKAVGARALDDTVEAVLRDAGMDSYMGCCRPQGKKGTYNLTESRKKLMLCYKKRFSELRCDPDIILSLDGV